MEGGSADMRIMQDCRREIRMMCADMIEVNWREDQRARRGTALLEDISPSGACLQMETAVPLGTRIHWDSPQQEFAGCVRYCVYREIGYFVGVEFEPGTKWSRKVYRPQHLLDPKRLLAQRNR